MPPSRGGHCAPVSCAHSAAGLGSVHPSTTDCGTASAARLGCIGRTSIGAADTTRFSSASRASQRRFVSCTAPMPIHPSNYLSIRLSDLAYLDNPISVHPPMRASRTSERCLGALRSCDRRQAAQPKASNCTALQRGSRIAPAACNAAGGRPWHRVRWLAQGSGAHLLQPKRRGCLSASQRARHARVGGTCVRPLQPHARHRAA